MSQRKIDHINMAQQSAPLSKQGDQRFSYEPLLGVHPQIETKVRFMNKTMQQALWISSMTGGTEQAGQINRMLAEATAEFGLGMALGSCRSLLDKEHRLSDFDLRPIIGNELPFFANIGIVQLEKLYEQRAFAQIDDRIVGKLRTDGIIIHINPTQEFLQPEGDRQAKPALETIEAFMEFVNNRYFVIVKEVGQGMGPESIDKLLDLNIDGIEFGAFGGTNFANIELMRNQQGPYQHLWPLATFGHSPEDMLDQINSKHLKSSTKQPHLIISGGIKNFLDGYYYIKQSKYPAVYGMANAVLQQALKSKQHLYDFIKAEKMGFQFAESFLKIK